MSALPKSGGKSLRDSITTNRSLFLLIFVLAGILPAFFLPFTQNYLNLSKQLLLTAAVLAGGIAWFGFGVRKKMFRFVRTPFDIPFALFSALYLASALLASNPAQGLLNIASNGMPSALFLIGLVILYFLIVNTVSTTQQVHWLLAGLSVSFVIVCGISLLDMLKFLPWLPQNFNPLGSQMDVVTFVAILLPVFLGYIVNIGYKKKRLLALIPLVLGLVLLQTIGYKLGWYIAALGALVFIALIFAFPNGLKIRINWMWSVFFVLIISVLSGFMAIPSVVGVIADIAGRKLEMPAEIRLGQSVSWSIATNTALDSLRQGVFGVGPGSFDFAFSAHRPMSFNNNPLWSIRFAEAGGGGYEALATIGVFGTLVLLLIFVIAIVFFALIITAITYPATQRFLISARYFKVKEAVSKQVGAYVEQGPLFAGILASMVAFVYVWWISVPPQAVWFVWIILLGCGVALFNALRPGSATTVLTVKESPQHGLFMSFGFVTLIVAGIFLGVYVSRVYVAEIAFSRFSQAIKAQKPEEFTRAGQYIDQALRLNNDFPPYYLAASQLALLRAGYELRKDAKEFSKDAFTEALGNAINLSKQAVDLDVKNVAVWEQRAGVFENAAPFISDARDWAIKSYEEALRLEPTNPGLQYRVGVNRYLSALDDKGKIKNENLFNIGISEMNKALQLKPIFFDARIAIARAYEQNSNTEKGVTVLQEGVIVGDRSKELYYELARMEYNRASEPGVDSAILLRSALDHATTAINASSGYANARYTRALIYNKLGQRDQALDDLRAVLISNPNSEDIKKLIDEWTSAGVVKEEAQSTKVVE